PRVELDDLFNALDPKTRAAVSKLFPSLDAALAGHEQDAQATIDTAGPALDALAELLQAVGSDGPALRQLLTSLQELSARLVARKDSVRQPICWPRRPPPSTGPTRWCRRPPGWWHRCCRPSTSSGPTHRNWPEHWPTSPRRRPTTTATATTFGSSSATDHCRWPSSRSCCHP